MIRSFILTRLLVRVLKALLKALSETKNCPMCERSLAGARRRIRKEHDNSAIQKSELGKASTNTDSQSTLYLVQPENGRGTWIKDYGTDSMPEPTDLGSLHPSSGIDRTS